MSSVAGASKLGHKVTVVLEMEIGGIHYYEIFARNETMNTVRYLQIFKKSMNHWRGNRIHAVWVLARFYHHALITPGLSKQLSNARFNLLILPI